MDEQRQEVTSEMTLKDILLMFSEGNPGAITTMVSIVEKQGSDSFTTLLSMDDMNIRGTQIWIGFKEHCESDLDKFIEAINKRDKEMVETINKYARQGHHKHLAVAYGASSVRKYVDA